MFHSSREMSLVIKTNGDGAVGLVHQPAEKAARLQTAPSSRTAAENEVSFQTADGVELRARLEDTVRAHSVADVTVGSFLSGGLDSAMVTGLI